MFFNFFDLKEAVTRAKAIQERLDGTKESASFEIGALFTRLYGEEKSAAISKLADFLVPSSPSYIVLALNMFISFFTNFALRRTRSF